MIKNERQYKITKTKLEDLETSLAGIDRHDPNLHPRQILGRVNSLERTIRDLHSEIDEYDRLKNGEVAEIEVKSLKYPSILISIDNLTSQHLRRLTSFRFSSCFLGGWLFGRCGFSFSGFSCRCFLGSSGFFGGFFLRAALSR